MIAVDIDSTLYDFETPAREAFKVLAADTGNKDLFKGMYVPWTEWRSPADSCGLEAWLRVIDMVHEDSEILDRDPFPGAVETLQEIAAYREIIYVTSRHQLTHAATERWLAESGFPSGNLYVSGESKRKHLNDCQFIIDDRPRTLIEFIYDQNWGLEGVVERKAFGLMFEYNRALTDIPNIYLAPTWLGLAHYLRDKGVIG